MKIVKTIDNGDCLFAAFGMAYHDDFFNVKEQSGLAKTVREAVVDDMKNKAFWDLKDKADRELGRITGLHVTPLLEESDRESLEPYVKAKKFTQKTVDLAYAYPAKGSTDAYTKIMRQSGVWGGRLEILGMAYACDCDIIVISDNPESGGTFIAPEHDGHAPVYLHYNGVNHYQAIIHA